MANSNLPYQEGTIKLTWIDPKNYEILNSSMFENVESAVAKAPKNNWMLFKLDKTDGINYTWKLLPYGDYKQYLSSMKFRDNKLLYFGGLAVVFVGIFTILNKIDSK
jgi:hypothetical protein